MFIGGENIKLSLGGVFFDAPCIYIYKNQNLKILQLKINGIKNKIPELQQLLAEESIDVAVIQETRLHPSSKTPTISNYSVIRQDRPILAPNKSKTNGGGLITYIKTNLPYTKIGRASCRERV